MSEQLRKVAPEEGDDTILEGAYEHEVDATINGLRAYRDVGEFLENRGLVPQTFPESRSYHMSHSTEKCELNCQADIDVEIEHFRFMARPGVKIPAEFIPAVTEFITRANNSLSMGNFALDLDGGYVDFRSGISFKGEFLTENLIRNIFTEVVVTLDVYLPSLLRVAFGGLNPREAIEAIKADGEGEEE